MEHILRQIFSLSTHDLYTPLGLIVTFFVALTGEFGVSLPFYMDAAYIGAGVAFVHGSYTGLILFPLTAAAAALGAWLCLWALQHGFGWLWRFVLRVSPKGTVHFLERVTGSSFLVVTLVRELPAMQLPLTAVWAAGRGPQRPFIIGVALSAVIHGASLMAMGAISGTLLYEHPAQAFWWSMAGAVALGFLLIAIGRLVQHVFRPAPTSETPPPEHPNPAPDGGQP